MKAAVLHAYDEKLTAKEFVKYEDVDDPKIIRPSDVVIRIGGAGVCRTDLHIVEGIWRSKVDVNLPYIMGHENAGWVEEIGEGVASVKIGDAVICHPLVTSGHCLACRRGNDMHAEDSSFPGINANGGYAQYLLTGERSLIKLPRSLAPKDVAPYTDAGLTAYRAAKKASRHLLPGEYAVIIGAGGLGHIGIQVLAALCAAEIIVVDRSDKSLKLAKECGAHHLVKADDGEVDEALKLTRGKGAEAVIDFVGEGDSVAAGLAMTRNQGFYYIVGYGGKIDIPTIDMITSEKTIVGNLVGTYAELVELMALADRGLVKLHTREYKLSAANDALHDLHAGKVNGRAVLIPVRREPDDPRNATSHDRRDESDARSGRESMLARQKLIDAMIDNNMRQLKFDNARGGAEIERACAVRDCEKDPGAAEPIERLGAIDLRLHELAEEQRRLVAEREWLNQSLFEFDQTAEAGRRVS